MATILNLPNELINEIIKLLPNDKYHDVLLSNNVFNVLSQNEINYRKYNDKSLIELALAGDLNGIEYLISKGYNYFPEIDWAFILNAENGHLDIIKYLVSDWCRYTCSK